jgi:hypothetical protein
MMKLASPMANRIFGVVDRALMAVIEGVDRASLIDVVNVGKGVSGPIFLTAVSYMSM